MTLEKTSNRAVIDLELTYAAIIGYFVRTVVLDHIG